MKDRQWIDGGDGDFPPILRGLRVLVVEDESLVAMALEEVLHSFGCRVAGVARSVAEALALIDADAAIDAAILDIRLGDGIVYPVADVLARRGTGFVFSTGGGPDEIEARYPGHEVLQKPYPTAALARALARAASWGR